MCFPTVITIEKATWKKQTYFCPLIWYKYVSIRHWGLFDAYSFLTKISKKYGNHVTKTAETQIHEIPRVVGYLMSPHHFGDGVTQDQKVEVTSLESQAKQLQSPDSNPGPCCSVQWWDERLFKTRSNTKIISLWIPALIATTGVSILITFVPK